MPPRGTAPRLERILVLVPWVIAHPGSRVDEVCERFGMTRAELLADLDLLFVCGLPPFGPGDLIEAYVEGDHVVIDAADYLARPMRLTRGEAVGLLVMGRAIASLPAVADADSLHRGLGKLARALAPEDARAAADLAERVAVELEGAGGEPMLAALRDAIAGRGSVRITYYSFGRDELTERDVDPSVVFSALGNWYLVAHDHASGEERVFRVDRIKELAPTGATFEVPAGSEAAAARGTLFAPSPSDVEVTLELSPAAAWVREVTPHERSEELPDGRTRLTLRTPHLEWLERLLLRLGGDATVVGPAELGGRVRERARRAVAAYAARGARGPQAAKR